MQFVKSLIGGLIGGAIGAVIFHYLKQENGYGIPWASLLVGVLAGIGVRIFCGADRSLITGITAAVVTLGMLLGLQYYKFSSDAGADVAALKAPIPGKSTAAQPVAQPEKDANSDTAKNENGGQNKTNSGESATEDKKAPADGSAANKSNDSKDTADNKDASTADNAPPKRESTAGPSAAPSTRSETGGQAASSRRPVPTNNKRSRNEAIAFGLAGLLAYGIGRGDGKRASSGDA